MNFETTLDEITTPTLDEHPPVDDVETPSAEPITDQTTEPVPDQESPTTAAARVLELAAVTADRLVADAETEDESLVTTARESADAIGEASRTEAQEAAAELARTKEQQTAQLEQERTTALSGLADEKAALEAQIATLRQIQSDHRSQLRDHLNEQLSLLAAAVPELPAAVAG